jgi:hypothetical protein
MPNARNNSIKMRRNAPVEFVIERVLGVKDFL